MDATAAAAAAALGASAKDGSETGAKIKFTYEQAIREVVLRKAESEVERGMRLARLVMTRWRAPVYRRLFEEQVITTLQEIGEVNEVADQLETGMWCEMDIGNSVLLH